MPNAGVAESKVKTINEQIASDERKVSAAEAVVVELQNKISVAREQKKTLRLIELHPLLDEAVKVLETEEEHLNGSRARAGLEQLRPILERREHERRSRETSSPMGRFVASSDENRTIEMRVRELESEKNLLLLKISALDMQIGPMQKQIARLPRLTLPTRRISDVELAEFQDASVKIQGEHARLGEIFNRCNAERTPLVNRLAQVAIELPAAQKKRDEMFSRFIADESGTPKNRN